MYSWELFDEKVAYIKAAIIEDAGKKKQARFI